MSHQTIDCLKHSCHLQTAVLQCKVVQPTKIKKGAVKAASIRMHGRVVHKAQAHVAVGRYQVQQAAGDSTSKTDHVISSIMLSHRKPATPSLLLWQTRICLRFNSRLQEARVFKVVVAIHHLFLITEGM